MKLIIDRKVSSIDLSKYLPYVRWSGDEKYFLGDEGYNHCKLLAYLSSQLPDGARVADLGTFHGHSAIALAYNEKVLVRTFDIADAGPQEMSYKSLPNIEFIHGNCKLYISTLLDCHMMLLDISPHDGRDEREFVNELERMGYRGIVICDDIKLSEAMISFWNDVKQKKLDATAWGHWSGTGIIIFDEKFLDVVIE